MRVYTFSYEGEALGGVIVVVAVSSAQARRLAKKEIGNKKLELEGSILFSGPVVVYDWNGDY